MTSVIIVTYNRKLLLKECLESISTQELNKEVEIIVIDNYSSDGTEDFIKKSFGNSVKFFKNYSRMSLSACKTSGVNIAGGDVIAFIDDDCLASKNWLNEIKKSLTSYDFAGGATLPMPDTIFPWWWRKSLNWLIGINTEPSKKFLPLGGNIAFNKYVLDTLQKNGQNSTVKFHQYLPYTEDNYRIKKALDTRFSMGINSYMIVYHRIPRERLRMAYLIERSYNEGRALVTYENSARNILFSLFALSYNFVSLFISLDINRIFRIISNASYILHWIKAKLMSNAENL